MSNEVLKSWEENADEWVDLLDREGIVSRRITNLAIINTVMTHARGLILDLGCGEGWLTRALSDRGREVCGADGTAALIYRAREQSADSFYKISYEDLIDDTGCLEIYPETIVFNYSLYGEELVLKLLMALSSVQNPGSRLIIQTVHPHFLMQNDQPYVSRWIDNAWKGLDGDFKSPHQWYCRTTADWVNLLSKAGYRLAYVAEPSSSDGRAISLILMGERI